MTAHAAIPTPVFMPVATHGFMRAVPIESVIDTGAPVILGNTYHLHVRPGIDRVEALGGLHAFMAWPRAILTDSGGFQITSLADHRRVTDDGIVFKSHVDGSEHVFTPESVVEAQARMGVDIAMLLDECTPHPYTPGESLAGLERTLRWAERAAAVPGRDGQLRFCITQGGVDPALRSRAARELNAMPFDGNAIGGLGIGEGRERMYETLRTHVPELREDRPRYLMGVGPPGDLVEAVAAGVDMFDCVIPSRHGRNGVVYTDAGVLHVKVARLATSREPIDRSCPCPACRRHSLGYLNHLFKTRDSLMGTLLTLHNLHYFQRLMQRIRDAIDDGTFDALRARVLDAYPPKKPGIRPRPKD